MREIYGIIPPVITPFDINGELDTGTLKKSVNFYLDSGVHGLSFGGSTGEGSTLSSDELYRGVKIIREAAPDMPVLCGVIRNCTRDAVEAGLAAKAAGADALMVTPKFYFSNDDDGNYAFYKELCLKTGMPLIIYNVIAANPISSQLLLKMRDIKNLYGIKQSVGGLHELGEMLRACGDSVRVYGAQDDLSYVSFLMGAAGSISAVHAVFPRESVLIWNAVKAGDIETAKSLQYRMMPVIRLCGKAPFPNGYREAARQLGCPVGLARHPLLPVSREYSAMMDACLKENGFKS